MKKIITLVTITLTTFACKEQEGTEYISFGEDITPENVITPEQMAEKFHSLKESDTIDVKFHSTILDICQKKGCWMSLDLKNKEEVIVRFKDYGFFVPMDASGNQSIVEGKAYLSVTSVDQLKHFAKEAKKSQEEIDAITEPRIRYMVMSNGVLIENKNTEEAVN